MGAKLLLLSFCAHIILQVKVVSSQYLLKEGSYCNINEDCEHSCCLDKKCAPTYNDCLALQIFDRFVEENYCDYNVECTSRCCLHGECMPTYEPCFDRYDRPLLMGAAVGVGAALVLMFLAFLFTPQKPKPIFVPPPPPKEEEFVDDGGPLYYEADEKIEEPEDDFKDDGGPIYYEGPPAQDDGGHVQPPTLPEDIIEVPPLEPEEPF